MILCKFWMLRRRGREYSMSEILTDKYMACLEEGSLRETQDQMPGAELCGPQPGNDLAEATYPLKKGHWGLTSGKLP